MLIGHSVNSPPNLLRPNDSANLGYPLPGISFGEGDNFFMGGIDVRHAVQIVRTAFAIRCFERLELSLSGSITDPDPYFDHVSVLRTPSGVLRETHTTSIFLRPRGDNHANYVYARCLIY